MLEARVTASAALGCGHRRGSRCGASRLLGGFRRDEQQEHQADEDVGRRAGCVACMVASVGGVALTTAPLAY
jgi:hypothetical protein